MSSPWAARYFSSDLAPVDRALEGVLDQLQIPSEIVFRNPGISPIAMNNLLGYFRERIKPIEGLVPSDPASDDAVDSYTAVFARIAKTLSLQLGPPGKRSRMLALLVSRWMRGYTLARLISDRISFVSRSGSNDSIAKSIRGVMEDVEQIARFEAPKNLACYTDILRMHLQEVERLDLIPLLPDLTMMLEFGVSQPTQTSLISLGLSRTAAVAVSEYISDAEMSQSEVLRWLRDEQSIWEAADLPALVKEAIEKMLQNQATTDG